MHPVATYRLQLHAGFTFRDALAVVPYLDALGVSHLYLSPILAARPGSIHGYDVTDPTALNTELGTEDDFRELVAAARARGLGIVLDVVPNHMLLGPANPWWRDVLEHGPSSPYAGYFDIAWDDPPRDDLRGRVLLPILGAPYAQVLESGELTLDRDGGAFVVHLYGTAFPVDPRTYDRVMKPVIDALGESDAATELQSVLTAVRHLPPRTETDPERVREGRAETEVIKRRIATVTADPAVSGAFREVLTGFRDDRLDELLDAQAYRLCNWRVASDEINYRRFFDVNELSAVAAEREDVFSATHELLLRLCREGLVDGLRIDHPDGLYDPKQYLERLQAALSSSPPRFGEGPGEGLLRGPNLSPQPPPRSGEGEQEAPFYVVVEKILDRSEQLPADWPTAGTTGYEFLNAVGGLFLDPDGEAPLTHLYHEFSGRDDPFADLANTLKWLVVQSAFAGELDVLARRLDRLARRTRRGRDFTLNGLRRALRAVIAAFPVYRSYVTDTVSTADERVVVRAVRQARRRSPTLSDDLFDFVRDTVLLRGAPDTEYAAEQRAFAGKFQQTTAPVMAKGVEDTTFYVYNRFVALNEVGGDPSRFGWPPRELHKFLADRQARHPGGLSTGSTHDTKRGEDVRARLAVLSELPDEWAACVRRWSAWNRSHRAELDDGFRAPDSNDEYLFYQTLVGAWPLDADRARDYMRKAIHEAKQHTSWINPDPEYDAAVRAFVEAVLDPQRSAEFLADLEAFATRVAKLGAANVLSQALVRCTAPGVPDTYQGTESDDLSLVDPDNRRPVDYDRRRELLAEMGAGGPVAGGEKLFVVSRALQFRRANADLFREGAYLPLEATGTKAGHVFAFARQLGDRFAVTVVPRLTAKLDGWGDTQLTLPAAGWVNQFTGQTFAADAVSVGELLARFPVALLVPASRAA